MQGKGPGFDPPRDLQHGPLAQSAERYPSQELLSLNDPEGINRHLAQSEARSPLETEVGGSSPPMSKGPRPGQGRGPAIFPGRKNVSTTCGDTSGGSGSDGHTHRCADDKDHRGGHICGVMSNQGRGAVCNYTWF